MTAATDLTRIQHLNQSAVQTLVDEHSARSGDPLVLAVRYELDDPLDIALLEVLADFPGAPDDEPLITEFGPTASLRVVGKLHLVLASPAQLLAACQREDAEITRAKSGKVLFDNHPAAPALRQALGL